MRTTVDIDDDVMSAIRDIAARRRITLGAAISELARNALLADAAVRMSDVSALGFPALPKRDIKQPITLELVNRLREELDC